jgi:peptide/nickel transport system ATP-binding protein
MRVGNDALLEVAGLQTFFYTRHGIVKAVDGVSFSVRPAETLAIVGESGCGKSVTALSLMRLVPDPPGRIVGGTVRLAGADLLALVRAWGRARQTFDDLSGSR